MNEQLGQENRLDIQRKSRLVPLLVIGSLLGIFVLLFAMANDDWVVVSLPSAPWSDTPAWPIFESRLWAVMLISSLIGVFGTSMATWFIRSTQSKAASKYEERIRLLESEIEKTNRLLSATQKSR